MRTCLMLACCALTCVTIWGSPVSSDTTPAERAIEQARNGIVSDAGNHEAYNALGVALCRRARESSRPGLFAEAEAAVQKSLEISPGNMGALRVRTLVLLGRKEYGPALKLAEELNRRVPDDVAVYGFLVEGHAALGNYEEAEKACNWMLKLRPGNLPALMRAAEMREWFGDLDGAVEALTKAYSAIPAAETEERAWTLTQIARMRRLMGRPGQAAQVVEQALAQFPAYPVALAELAWIRLAERKYDEAVRLLEDRLRRAPRPAHRFEYAEALRIAGRESDAAKAFGEFEREAMAEADQPDNANRELVYYFADHAGQPAQALEIASRELGRRRDVLTMAAHAWALYRNGREEEARRELAGVLKVGVRDARILGHARALGLVHPTDPVE